MTIFLSKNLLKLINTFDFFSLSKSANKLEVLMPVEIRIEELRHRLHIESAVCEGAKNAVNILQTQKTDKKALQQVINTNFKYSNAFKYIF